MKNALNLKSIALGLALMLLPILGHAQSDSDQDRANLPSPPRALAAAHNAEAVPTEADPNNVQGALASGYCTYRFNGMAVLINCSWSQIHANSRVFLAMSEYSGTPQERFIGAAQMTVHNISPYEGGVQAEVDVNWGSPLNIRVDVLVD